ncbi:type IX secretion system plug protein [Rufibacter roseus]|uniref:Type IX secretion system plug protein domain-containing protein n=1 Tax=Rufibacter roseus TaxID=1567108 RepID=A0ABW2DRY5_9BACT|nr:type IX secretion system plug protein domain-containing protein [Rufibacter roseus]
MNWKKGIIAFALAAFSLHGCVPVESTGYGAGATGTGNTLQYNDVNYTSDVRSVQLYTQSRNVGDVLAPPLLSMNQSNPLILEFDRMSAPRGRAVVKLHHCDINWKPSQLTSMQFVADFNEFFINEVEASTATKIPYWHYFFQVPRVKLSGNYLIEVSEEGGNLLLSRRFVVFEELVQVGIKPMATPGAGDRFARQQMDLNVFYAQYPLVNPAQEIKVVLRQNHRWDNAKFILRPTFTHEAQRRLEYQLFDTDYSFLGLNEFRALDTRSERFSGIGVERRDITTSPDQVFATVGRTRADQVYSTQPDANGKYLFGSREYGRAALNADYQRVFFRLYSPEPAPGPVYVFGGLTDWQMAEPFRLTYNAENQLYTGSALLKQGYYNYYFVVKGANGQSNAQYYEGSHFATENVYDALVYYRPPGTRADLIIGYSTIQFNPQR